MPVTTEEWGSSTEHDWVRLALWVGSVEQEGVEWSVLYGPGGVKGDQYEVRRNRRDRFAVVAGRVESSEWGVFEGFVILPLPLDGAVEGYQAQSSLDRRLRLASGARALAHSASASQP
ncbi:hypothetical protein D3C79_860460 [compost metagenome]